ncbi:MAG: thiol:disulfide interchange protein DsbD [Candidatus Binatia bacterium]|nr:MAG: thiol:disulfide interchange protein DsbD [Candidatus Binatia bacterium]
MLRKTVLCLALAAAMVLPVPGVSSAREKVQLSLEFGSSEIVRGTPVGLDVVAVIEPGWHIQAHRPSEPFLVPTELRVEVPEGVTVEEIQYPKPDPVPFRFASGKELLVYQGKIGMATALHVPADFGAESVRVEAVLRYQACNDDTCLPPALVRTSATLPVVGEPTAATGRVEPSRVFHVGEWVRRYGLLWTLGAVFLLGLGLNLTPCVYPLISVTLAYFGTQARGETRKVLVLACLYFAGIVSSFSVLGVAAALSGGFFGAALRNPAVLVGVAALLVVLAFGSFGFYEIRLPAALAGKAGRALPGLLGAFVMGLTMGVVAAPCVGPVVVGLLVFVGAQGNPWLGWLLFATLASGLGVPYVGLALAADRIRRLPKSGAWQRWVEHFFGFVLLGLALYFAEPVLPARAARFLWPAWFVATGLFLGFLDPVGPRMRWARAALALVFFGAAAWMLRPAPAAEGVEWEAFSEEAFLEARERGMPVVLDFAADWCLPCKEMEKTTFADPEVREEAKHFRMMKVDLTREDERSEEVTKRFGVQGVPTTIFFDEAGREVDRLVGYFSRDEMLSAMRRARDGTRPGR